MHTATTAGLLFTWTAPEDPNAFMAVVNQRFPNSPLVIAGYPMPDLRGRDDRQCIPQDFLPAAIARVSELTGARRTGLVVLERDEPIIAAQAYPLGIPVVTRPFHDPMQFLGLVDVLHERRVGVLCIAVFRCNVCVQGLVTVEAMLRGALGSMN